MCVVLITETIWVHKLKPVVYTLGMITLFCALWSAVVIWQNSDVVYHKDLFSIDWFTLCLTIALSGLSLLTLLNALGYSKRHTDTSSELCLLILLNTMGLIVAVTANMLVISGLGLAISAISKVALVGIQKNNPYHRKMAWKVFVIEALSLIFFFYGLSLFYAAFGSFHLLELANALASPQLTFLPKLALCFLLGGLLIPMCVVPFGLWSPDITAHAPAPISGFIETAPRVAAFGLAFRIFAELRVLEMDNSFVLFYVLAIASLCVGFLLALSQNKIKNLLAWASLGHAGWIITAIVAGNNTGAFSPLSLDIALHYLLGYALTTIGLYSLISLLIKERTEATDFLDLQGLGKRHPVLGVMFALFLLSLAGFPGTIGFVMKFQIVFTALAHHHTGLVGIALFTTCLGFYLYLRPIAIMFWSDPPTELDPVSEISFTTSIVVTLCAFGVVYCGIYPDLLIKLTRLAVLPFKP